MASTSVLGAIAKKLLASTDFQALIPGGIHANELPPKCPYPGVVIRYTRTEYQWFTLAGSTSQLNQARAPRIEKCRVELDFECLDAEQGETIGRKALNLLLDKQIEVTPVSLASGTAASTVQLFPLDFYLRPDVGRNPSGDKQYTWVLVLEVWLDDPMAS